MGAPTDCMNCGWPPERHTATRCPGGDDWERYEPHPLNGLPRWPIREQRAWRTRLRLLVDRSLNVDDTHGPDSPEARAAFSAIETHACRKPTLLPWCWTLWRRRR